MIESVAGIIRAARTPWRVRADQRLAGRRQPADERGEREEGETEQEHPPAAEEVDELAAREHEDGEGEGIGVHRPLELGKADAEVPLDRRERDDLDKE
jgi:hypothetical protein